MGHNFGMSHDFDKKHGGDGKPDGPGKCNKKGIMSYGHGIPLKWSDCSISDFTGYYNSEKWGSTCLASEGNTSEFFFTKQHISHNPKVWASDLEKSRETLAKSFLTFTEHFFEVSRHHI